MNSKELRDNPYRSLNQGVTFALFAQNERPGTRLGHLEEISAQLRNRVNGHQPAPRHIQAPPRDIHEHLTGILKKPAQRQSDR